MPSLAEELLAQASAESRGKATSALITMMFCCDGTLEKRSTGLAESSEFHESRLLA